MLRRRTMNTASSGPKSVVLRDRTATGSGATFQASPVFTSAEIADYGTTKPDRIIIRLYAVAADETSTTGRVGLGLYNTGGYVVKNFSGSNGNSATQAMNFGDGTEVCVECVMTHVDGNTYSITTTTNAGKTYTLSYSLSLSTQVCFRAQNASPNLGPGTRIVVIFEYDN